MVKKGVSIPNALESSYHNATRPFEVDHLKFDVDPGLKLTHLLLPTYRSWKWAPRTSATEMVVAYRRVRSQSTWQPSVWEELSHPDVHTGLGGLDTLVLGSSASSEDASGALDGEEVAVRQGSGVAPVPALLVGDFFVPCNTAMGLLSQSPLIQDKSILREGEGIVKSPGTPGLDLLMRLAVSDGGHRVFYVNKEAAEAARRQAVLRRYRELYPQGKAYSTHPEGDEGTWWGPLQWFVDALPWTRNDKQDDDVRKVLQEKTSSVGQKWRELLDHPWQSDTSNKTTTESRQTSGNVPGPGHSVRAGLSTMEGNAPQTPEEPLPAGAFREKLEDFVEEIRRMEEAAVVAEALQIERGEGEEEANTSLHSYVARVPLEGAFRLLCGLSSSHKLAISEGDTEAVAYAKDKKASLNLTRSQPGKWCLELEDDEDDDEEEEEPRQKETDALPEPVDVLASSRTPIFMIPGLGLTLNTTKGPVTFTPAFMSLPELYQVASVGVDVFKKMWLRQRQKSREKWRRGIESFATALSGLAVASPPPTAAAVKPDEEEDDSEGLGDPPEAKDLLEELGERTPLRGTAGPSLPPPTGAVAVLNTIAVGAISIFASSLSQLGDIMDQAALSTPLGMSLVGIPSYVNVRATYLEDLVHETAEHNSISLGGAGQQSDNNQAGGLSRADLQQEEEQSGGQSDDEGTSSMACSSWHPSTMLRETWPCAHGGMAAGSLSTYTLDAVDRVCQSDADGWNPQPARELYTCSGSCTADMRSSCPLEDHYSNCCSEIDGGMGSDSDHVKEAHLAGRSRSEVGTVLERDSNLLRSALPCLSPPPGCQVISHTNAMFRRPEWVVNQNGVGEEACGGGGQSVCSQGNGHSAPASGGDNRSGRDEGRRQLVKSRSQVPSLELESLEGLRLLWMAGWAMFQDAKSSKGKLAASLLGDGNQLRRAIVDGDHASLRVSESGELYLKAQVEVKALSEEMSPRTLSRLRKALRREEGGGGSVTMRRGRRRSRLLSTEPEVVTHSFEIGFHLNLGKMLGEVGDDEPDQLKPSVDEEGGIGGPSIGRGVILLGDLGMTITEGDHMSWRTPPLGFADIAMFRGSGRV